MVPSCAVCACCNTDLPSVISDSEVDWNSDDATEPVQSLETGIEAGYNTIPVQTRKSWYKRLQAAENDHEPGEEEPEVLQQSLRKKSRRKRGMRKG